MESNRRIDKKTKIYGIIGASLLVIAILLSAPNEAMAMPSYIMNLLLSQMHDVQITNPVNGQVLTYNGTFWINANGGSGNATSGVTSIHAGNAITVNQTTGNVLVTNAGVYKNIAGNGITVNQTTGSVLITNSLPENTVCNNATSSTGHLGICKDNTVTLRTIKAGTGITATLNATDISLANAGVTSITGTSPISASASTGSVTISCPTCLTTGTARIAQLGAVGTMSSSANSNQLNQNAGTPSTAIFSSSTVTGYGEKANAGSALIGKTVNSITIGLVKANSPTGTANVCVLSATNTCTYTFGTFDISALTTSLTSYTFTNYASTVVIATNDRIGISAPTQTGNNTASMAIDTTDAYDTTLSRAQFYNAGWSNDGSKDLGSNTSPWLLDNQAKLYLAFTANKFLLVTIDAKTITNTLQLGVVFNDFQSSFLTNYASRISINGGADATNLSDTTCKPNSNTNINAGDRPLLVFWIDNNLAGDTKVLYGNIVYGADSSAGTAPSRAEFSCKWTIQSAQISSIALVINAGSGAIDADTYMRVWGFN